MGTKEFCIKFFVHYIILAFVNGMEWDYSQGETGETFEEMQNYIT